jgi:hypothetical protein
LTGTLFCVFQAALAACEGDRDVLIKELEKQLATVKEGLCKEQDKPQVNFNEIIYK